MDTLLLFSDTVLANHRNVAWFSISNILFKLNADMAGYLIGVHFYLENVELKKINVLLPSKFSS